jgi:hypothetical protein
MKISYKKKNMNINLIFGLMWFKFGFLSNSNEDENRIGLIMDLKL